MSNGLCVDCRQKDSFQTFHRFPLILFHSLPPPPFFSLFPSLPSPPPLSLSPCCSHSLDVREESCGIAASPDVAMPESSLQEKFGRRLKASQNSPTQPVARVLTSFIRSFVRSFVFAGQGKSLRKETRRNVSFSRKRMSVAFLKIPYGDATRILMYV